MKTLYKKIIKMFQWIEVNLDADLYNYYGIERGKKE